MTKNRINTELSALVSRLQDSEEIRMCEAAKMLGLSESETEDIAKKLSEYNILEIRYSLKGYKTLRKGSNAVRRESCTQSHKRHTASPETERLYNEMRHITAQKRGCIAKEKQDTLHSAGRDDAEYERHKRLKEIREGLISVRENLAKIRERLDCDLQTKREISGGV